MDLIASSDLRKKEIEERKAEILNNFAEVIRKTIGANPGSIDDIIRNQAAAEYLAPPNWLEGVA